VPGQALPTAGHCRFGRSFDASVLALGLQKGPERRASLRWNQRKFLSFRVTNQYPLRQRPRYGAPSGPRAVVSCFVMFLSRLPMAAVR